MVVAALLGACADEPPFVEDRTVVALALDGERVVWMEDVRGTLELRAKSRLDGEEQLLLRRYGRGGGLCADASGVWALIDHTIEHAAADASSTSTTASDLVIKGRFACDGSALFFVDEAGMSVVRLGLDGVVTTVVGPVVGKIGMLAVDQDATFWTFYSGMQGHLMRASKTDGVPVEIGPATGSLSVAGDRLVLVSYASIQSVRASDGGDPRQLLELDGGPLGPRLKMVAVDHDTVVAVVEDCPTVSTTTSVPAAGGEPISLASHACSDFSEVSGLAVDDEDVFVARSGETDDYFATGGVWRIAR